MCSTQRDAIEMCWKREAGKIVVAPLIAGQRTAREIAALSDETVILETPFFFRVVAEAHENWYYVPDEESSGIMRRLEKSGCNRNRRE